MDALPSRKKERGLTQETLDILLMHLDPDRDRAGKIYEKIQLKLITFFEGRGCLDAEDLADETINRLAQRYAEGGTIENPTTYSFGIAKNVFLEWLKRRDREIYMLKQLSAAQLVKEDTEEPDPRLECFEICLEKLPEESRKLVVEYYQGEKHEKIENRKRMAERMGISLNSLRIQAYRIRVIIEDCIEDCLEKKLYG